MKPQDKGSVGETPLRPEAKPPRVLKKPRDREWDLDNLSYFGYTERPFFDRMSRARTRWFRPILEVCKAVGIRPNHLTATAFIVLIIGFPAGFLLGRPGLSFLFLALNIVLDGMDGPLAKISGGHSRSGTFWDSLNDLTTMVVVLIISAHFGLIHSTVAFGYVAAYLYLTFVAIGQNALRVSFRFVTKSKYPTYTFLLIHALTGFDLATWFCLIMIPIMIWETSLGAWRIARALDDSD